MPKGSSAMETQHRFIQTKPLKVRLMEEAQSLREQANLLPFGAVRDAALKKARQAEAAAHMDDWLTLPGLSPLKNDDTHGQN
jgi:hypothetical protein